MVTMSLNTKVKYGWTPDLPDLRDQVYSAGAPAELPPKVDLISQCPPVVNQGSLGSCTANAIGALYEFVQRKETTGFFTPSRLFIYYNERVIEDTVAVDGGARIRNGMKTVNKTGVCPETDWPYVVSKFAKKPPTDCYTEASEHKVVAYKRLTSELSQLKACLAEGYPFVFGFYVFDSFHSAEVSKTGMVPLPAKGEKAHGGHAVLCVGYDDDKQSFLVRNSWGTAWGLEGYCWMPYSYLTSTYLAADFWTIRQTTDSGKPAPKPRKKSFWEKVKDFFFPSTQPFHE
jgi:C1A family cysteine protease